MSISPKRAGGVAYASVMFLAVSVLMGLLAAGLVVPFAAAAGAGSKAANASIDLLPEDLETPPQPERSKILMGDGSLLAYFYDENRIYTKLENISPLMREAQVAIEDHRFYEHGAVDPVGTLRAFLRNSASDSGTAGGSTITQQYVKMVQIEKAKSAGDEEGVQAAQEKSYARKVQEMRYAIALEKKLSKDEILERYLNIAYYGDGVYGVEQAAKHYFDTSAKKLNLDQSAFLAGLVQNPTATDPTVHPEAAVARRNVVLTRMGELGLAKADAVEKAKKVKWDPSKVEGTPNGCIDSEFPFLCDYVRRTLLADPALGKTAKDREDLLTRGGLTIRTKIDKATQRTAEKAITKFIDPKDPVISTMTLVEPGTGLIVAMAQSRPEMGTKKGQTFYNYAVPGSLGGAEGFQAGSTFKPITAAAALEKGYPMSKTYDAKSPMSFKGQTFETCENPNEPIDPNYRPKNSTRSGNNMTMTNGMKWSVNTYFLQLARDTGNCEVTEMAKKLGIKMADGQDITTQDGIFSFTLGPIEITPLSMAEAYSTFAARGIHCNPIIIESVKNVGGKSYDVPQADCKRVIPKRVADGVNKLLNETITSGTGAPANPFNGYQLAGKTGTTDSNQAVWFCGYSPELAGCSSIAVDKTNKFWKGRRDSLKGLSLPESGNYLNGSGGGDAGAKIWKPTMEKALDGRPKTKFKKPSDETATGKTVDVPSVSGLSASQARSKLEKAGFSVQNTYVTSGYPQDTYLGATPNRTKQFGTVYLMFSSGPAPKPEKKPEKKSEDKKSDSKPDEKKTDDKKTDENKDKKGD